MKIRADNQSQFRASLSNSEKKGVELPKLLVKGGVHRGNRSTKAIEWWRASTEMQFPEPVGKKRATYLDANDSVLLELAIILDIRRSSRKLPLSSRLQHSIGHLKSSLLRTAALPNVLTPLKKPLTTSKSAPKALLSYRKVKLGNQNFQ